MKNYFRKFLLFGALLIAVVVLWRFWETSRHDDGKRHFIATLRLAGRIGTEVPRFTPVVLKGYPQALYVVDYGDLTVKKFSLDGKLLASYGGKRGEGPGELRQIVDIAVNDSNLWIVDTRARKILRFNEVTGQFWSEFSVPDMHPLRIAQVGPYLFVMGLGPFEELFVQYDTSGRLIRRFGIITERQAEMKINLQGVIANLGDTALVFVPLMAGYAFVFDTTGVLQERIPLLDVRSFPRPRIEDRASGRVYHATGSDIVNYSVSIDRNYLLINTVYHNHEEQYFIDRYDLHTQRYVHSVLIPNQENCKMAYWIKDKVFVLSDTSVVTYSVQHTR